MNVAHTDGAEKAQVWVVDDDRSIRWVLEKALGRAGLGARMFSSANELLEALEPIASRRCWSRISAGLGPAASSCCRRSSGAHRPCR